jgi:hypothetical protein
VVEVRPLVALAILSFLVGSLVMIPSVSHPVGILLTENLVDPTTARSAAMAGALCSSPGDYDAMMYNPATLGFTRDIHASVGYYWRSLWDSWAWHCFQAGIVYPVWDMSSLGASFLYFRDTEMTAMDPNGNPLGTVKPYKIVSSLSYGRALTADLSAGATGRLILDSFPALDPFRLVTASAAAVDISLHYRLPIPTVNTAVSLTNWGSDMEFPEGYYSGTGKLPTAFRTGVSVVPKLNDGLGAYLGFDYSKILVEEREASARFGGEINLFQRVFLRAGYLWDQRSYMGGLTYGAGLGIPGIGSVSFASASKAFKYDVSKNHFSLDLQLPLSWKSVASPND